MRYDTWSDDWTVLSVGVVHSADAEIWYCISVYEIGEETLPLAA